MNIDFTLKEKILLSPLWLLTKLPLRRLFYISDLLFYITYYMVRYRRKIVFNNLRQSFPEKSLQEITNIERKFYRYLCDYFIESIYIMNMDAEECSKRYMYVNPEIIEELYAKKRNFILAISHYGNWEWNANLPSNIPHINLGVYKPITNKVFDKLFQYLRGKYGSLTVPMRDTLRVISECLKKDKLFVLDLVADQRPSPEDLGYWTHFFNQETPVITGFERLARKYNLAVVFLEVDRVKRGYYKNTYKLITDEPNKEAKNAIIEKYIREVEQMIIKRPEFWLWSHNRWKYKPEIYKPKTA